MEIKNVEKIKETIRTEILNRYETMDNFQKTDFCKENPKVYKTLFPSASISYPALKSLCEFLGIGKLDKKVVVVRTNEYTLNYVPSPKKHMRKTK